MIDSTELFGDDFGAERMWGLKELPLPGAVDWWPVAPGWYGVLALLALVLAYAMWRAWRRYNRNAYRREARRRIRALAPEVAGGQSLGELPSVLRRAALASHPRGDVAGLRGAQWVAWLNSRAGRELFVTDDAARLDALAYGARVLPEAELSALMTAVDEWLRRHRAEL